MKIGQVASFLDVGLVPEEYREEFQRKLGALRDAAPNVRFSDMRKVMEEEWGDRLEDVFDEFDEEPVAAASIGQVYRGTLEDGRDVAVKVQYPRRGRGRPGRHAEPGDDPAPHAAGRARARRPGDRRRRSARASRRSSTTSSRRPTSAPWPASIRDHPFITVPDVVGELSRERVLVMDLSRACASRTSRSSRPGARATASAEIVYRFFFGSMYRHRQFSGDPHPGNFLLREDGTMAFLDFGLFKRLPREARPARARRPARGHGAATPSALFGLFAGAGFLRRARPLRAPRACSSSSATSTWWYTERRGGPARAGDRHAGRDRDVRPALAALRPDAPRDAARRPPLRPAHGGADPGRALPAPRHGQLAPHRPRVDLRRPRRTPSSGGPRPSSTRVARRHSAAAPSDLLDLDQARRARAPAGQPGRDPDALALA